MNQEHFLPQETKILRLTKKEACKYTGNRHYPIYHPAKEARKTVPNTEKCLTFLSKLGKCLCQEIIYLNGTGFPLRIILEGKEAKRFGSS